MLRNLGAARELLESREELKTLLKGVIKSSEEQVKELRELNKNLKALLAKME